MSSTLAPTRRQLVLGVAGLATAAAAVAGGLAFAGILDKWDGTYAGVLRPSGLPWTVSVLSTSGEKDGATLVLNAPDFKGGSCTIAFERHLRRMEAITGQKCVGGVPGSGYALGSGASMDLDKDALSVRLKLTPADEYGSMDVEHQVTFDFVGARHNGAVPQGSRLFASYQALFCRQICTRCDEPCSSKIDPMQHALCSMACYRSSALCCHALSLPSESANCGCAGAQ